MVDHLLPPNATSLERALSMVGGHRLDLDVKVGTLWTAQTCPVEFLPFLAWAVSVDVWDDRWPERVKREVVESSIAVHRQHGTNAGMIRALAALGVEAEISEWWETGGQPYTFIVKARPTVDLIGDPTLPFVSAELQAQIERVVAVVKPVRAHATLQIILTAAAKLRSSVVVLINSTGAHTTMARRVIPTTTHVGAVATLSSAKTIAVAASKAVETGLVGACVARICSTLTLETRAV